MGQRRKVIYIFGYRSIIKATLLKKVIKLVSLVMQVALWSFWFRGPWLVLGLLILNPRLGGLALLVRC